MSKKHVLVLAALISAGVSQAALADADQANTNAQGAQMMTGAETGGNGQMGMTSGNSQMGIAGGNSQMGMAGGNSQMGMAGGGMMPMMQMMMQMHQSMMRGNSQMGMANGGGHADRTGDGDRIGMMDRNMMGMMMSGGDPKDLGQFMTERMPEFDTDSNGTLTLDEFENLHSNAMRDLMVDRFQNLDADADGQITQQEIDAAGARMGGIGAVNSTAK